MSTVLFRPLPLPPEGVRPGVGLLVLAFHVGLLWLANLYWPLHTVLLGAVQNTVQSVTVQIFQKTPERGRLDDSSSVRQAITTPGRQRVGRSEAMLALPPAQTQSSTPLAGTTQSVQTAPQRPVLAAVPPPVASTAASPAALAAVTARALTAASAPAPQAQPKSANDVAIAPTAQPVPPAVVRSMDESAPDAAMQKPATITPPTLPTLPTLPLPPATALSVATPSPVPASAPPAPAPASPVVPVAVAPAPATPVVPAVVTPAPATNPSGVTTAVTPNTPSTPANGAASGASQAAGGGFAAAGSPQGSAAAPGTPPSAAGTPLTGTPLNLSLPPRYMYRPPIALPQRSLADMANDQLRRKPRDAFAESVQSAGSIDCLKDAPDGAAQGLLAIGPLLKRAIEEKCRK